jgi:hypothetical protein
MHNPAQRNVNAPPMARSRKECRTNNDSRNQSVSEGKQHARTVMTARALKGRRKLAGGKRSAAPGHRQAKRRAPEGRWTWPSMLRRPFRAHNYKPLTPGLSFACPGANFRRPLRGEIAETDEMRVRLRVKLAHSKEPVGRLRDGSELGLGIEPAELSGSARSCDGRGPSDFFYPENRRRAGGPGPSKSRSR